MLGPSVLVAAADRRNVDVSSHTSLAAAECTVVTRSKTRALGVRAQVVGRAVTCEPLGRRDRAVLGDRVLQVHGADRRERERAVGHDRHVQRGTRAGAGRSAAGCPCVGKPQTSAYAATCARSIGHVVPGQRQVRQRRRRSCGRRAAGSRPGCTGSAALSISGRRRRRAVDHAGAGRRLHQAPSIIWPQTRTTLPLTAVEPGLANQAIVSATSTGRPPWRHRVEPAADLAGRERHGGGHLGLDEAGRDGVDRDAVLAARRRGSRPGRSRRPWRRRSWSGRRCRRCPRSRRRRRSGRCR